MLLSKFKAVSRPVDQGNSAAYLNEPKLSSENRVLIQELVNPVTALKRACATSCAALF